MTTTGLYSADPWKRVHRVTEPDTLWIHVADVLSWIVKYAHAPQGSTFHAQ